MPNRMATAKRAMAAFFFALEPFLARADDAPMSTRFEHRAALTRRAFLSSSAGAVVGLGLLPGRTLGAEPNAGLKPLRILILGGGFGGVYTARHLERLFRRRSDVEIVLVSRDNFLLMTPLLFEVFSGTLDLRSCSFPVRAFLHTTRFVEATVEGIDLNRPVVRLVSNGKSSELAYDHLVITTGPRLYAWTMCAWSLAITCSAVISRCVSIMWLLFPSSKAIGFQPA